MVNPLAEVVERSHCIDDHTNRPVVWSRQLLLHRADHSLRMVKLKIIPNDVFEEVGLNLCGDAIAKKLLGPSVEAASPTAHMSLILS